MNKNAKKQDEIDFAPLELPGKMRGEFSIHMPLSAATRKYSEKTQSPGGTTWYRKYN